MNSTNEKQLNQPIEFRPREEFIPVDQWTPLPEDEVFKTARGIVMLDVSSAYGMEPNAQLDAFVMSTKRSYNNPEMRDHICKYLNYLERYYDREHELASIYCMIKYLIDYAPEYTKEAFIYDLTRYIMNGSISIKVGFMNRDNYALNLTYRNVKNPNLQYSD